MIWLLLTETITFGVGHTFLRSAHSRVRSRLQPETRRTCAVTASLEELEPQSVDAGDSRSFALNRSSSYGHDDGTAAFGIARRLALGGVAHVAPPLRLQSRCKLYVSLAHGGLCGKARNSSKSINANQSRWWANA